MSLSLWWTNGIAVWSTEDGYMHSLELWLWECNSMVTLIEFRFSRTATKNAQTLKLIWNIFSWVVTSDSISWPSQSEEKRKEGDFWGRKILLSLPRCDSKVVWPILTVRVTSQLASPSESFHNAFFPLFLLSQKRKDANVFIGSAMNRRSWNLRAFVIVFDLGSSGEI